MSKIRSALAAFAVFAVLLPTQAVLAHEDHEIDRELLASKIRERGHTCTSVAEANEKSDKSGESVITVKCSDGNGYRLLVTSSAFEVTPMPSMSPSPTPATGSE